ncbi:TonB-dependent receptor, partial [Vibrio parahaemolyticus]|nr:TonB-dependent receptor [Vibrio parahaemolyticus]
LQENSRSGGEQSANFFVNGPLAENLSLQVYGQYTTREEDDIEYGYEDKDMQSISSKLTYQINERHSVQLEGGTSAQSRRGNVGLSVPTTGCRGGCEDSLNEYRRNYVTVSHNGDWDSIGISDTYLQREESENKSREMTITNTTFKSSLVTGIGNHTLTTGVDATHAELEDFTSNKASSKTETSNTQWAVFIEDEWRIADPFSVTLGGRLDHDENYGTHFSPRVYGVWRVDPSWTVK